MLAFQRRDLLSESEELQRDITPTAKENAECFQKSEDRVEGNEVSAVGTILQRGLIREEGLPEALRTRYLWTPFRFLLIAVFGWMNQQQLHWSTTFGKRTEY